MVVIIKNGQVYDKNIYGRLKLLTVYGVWSYNNGILAVLAGDKILVQDDKSRTIEVPLGWNNEGWIMSVWADEETTLYVDKMGTVHVYDNRYGGIHRFEEVIKEKDVTLNMLNNLHIDVSEDHQVAFSYDKKAYKATFLMNITCGNRILEIMPDTKQITCEKDYQKFMGNYCAVIEHNGTYMNFRDEHPNHLFSLKYGIYNSKRVMLDEYGYIELDDDEHPYFESEDVVNKGRINKTKPARK